MSSVDGSAVRHRSRCGDHFQWAFACGHGLGCVFILMRNIITAMFPDLCKHHYPSHTPFPRLSGINMFCYSDSFFEILKVNVVFISPVGLGKYPLIKHFNSGKSIWLCLISEILFKYSHQFRLKFCFKLVQVLLVFCFVLFYCQHMSHKYMFGF